ncbi:MAG TPA: SDR family oxidoreductase [Smithellaceae bacterium]|nr:SDR family oxidoreductase [Smithellaceae bacterium]
MKSIKDLMDLRGRVALITGGAGKIGSVMAEALAELGARIVILDLLPESCRRVSDRIAGEYEIETIPLDVDLTCDNEIRRIPERIVDEFHRLDILIHSAAFVGTSVLPGWVASFEAQSIETWRKAIDLNLTVPFTLTQACVPLLKKTGTASVINMASIYGILGPDMRLYDGTGMGNPAAYAASKGGLLQLTRWLATVLAPEIRVNAITPGGVWREQMEIFVNRYKDRTPLRRMASEEDLKGAAAYLASDLSAYVTGQNIVIDGGWSVW